jgi:HAMP domain-containing protein
VKATVDVRLQLAYAYVLFAAITAAGMYLSNKYISRDSNEELSNLIIGLIAGYLVILASQIVFTYARLRHSPAIDRAHAGSDRELREWMRMTHFPKELFWWVLVSGIITAQIYRLIVLGLPPWTQEAAVQYVKSTVFNVSTFTAMGMVHYSAARWILRPRIRELRVYYRQGLRFGSVSMYVVFVFGLGLFYLLLRTLWYALSSERSGEEPEAAVLLAIGGIVFAVTFLVVYLLAYYLFRDMNGMTVKLKELASAERANLHARIPVASPYELGELTSAFNALQDRLEREYKRVDKELALARQVQEQYFRHQPERWKGWRLLRAADSVPGVDEGFHDINPLSDRKLALAAGYITGTGLPSALVMSALIMLMRAKMTESTDPGTLLAELNDSLSEVMPGELRVHIGICVINEADSTATFASAGNMNLNVSAPDGNIIELRAAAEALGSRQAAAYRTATAPLMQGDCFAALHASYADPPSVKDLRPELLLEEMQDNRSWLVAYRAGKECHGAP